MGALFGARITTTKELDVIMKLKLVTYNMHKGKGFWSRRYQIAAIREQIKKLDPDIIFLQEVPGEHPKNHSNLLLPLEYFAEQVWPHHCYGKNAVYQGGHHGNAIMSKYKIDRFKNHDISKTSLAKRGLLHAQLNLNVGHQQYPLHLLNIHLDLTERARLQQVEFILQYARDHIAPEERIILAGDLNDWRSRLDEPLTTYFDKALHAQDEKSLRTFPSVMPIYDLDRVYTRHMQVSEAHVAQGSAWKKLSDHLPLSVDFHLE